MEEIKDDEPEEPKVVEIKPETKVDEDEGTMIPQEDHDEKPQPEYVSNLEELD